MLPSTTEFWKQINEELGLRKVEIPQIRLILSQKEGKKSFFVGTRTTSDSLTLRVKSQNGMMIPKGWTIPMAELRLKRLLKVFKRTCFYCGHSFPANCFNRDHLWPASRPESTHDPVFNIVLSCFRCNTLKGDRIPTEDEVMRARNIFWMEEF